MTPGLHMNAHRCMHTCKHKHVRTARKIEELLRMRKTVRLVAVLSVKQMLLHSYLLELVCWMTVYVVIFFFFPVMMFVIPGRNCKAAYKSALSWAGPMSLSAFPAWQTARRALYRVGLGFGSSSAPVLDTWQVLDLSGSFCKHLHFPSLVPLLEHMSAVSCFLYLENLVFLSPHCEHPGN